jgi:hypothetical protein
MLENIEGEAEIGLPVEWQTIRSIFVGFVDEWCVMSYDSKMELYARVNGGH